MRALLRRFAVPVAGLMCLCACSPVYAASTHGDSDGTPSSLAVNSAIIPGPLRSFMRMAGISQKIQPEDVMPLLARNSYLQGYENGRETEFLILLDRYVHQARELQALAGTNGTLHVANCEEAISLIQVLGYRLRQNCGQKNAFLVTANPERAFLTIDSGFPLTGLEEELQTALPSHMTFLSLRFRSSSTKATG